VERLIRGKDAVHAFAFNKEVPFPEQRSMPGLKGSFLLPGSITGIYSPNFVLHLKDIIS